MLAGSRVVSTSEKICPMEVAAGLLSEKFSQSGVAWWMKASDALL